MHLLSKREALAFIARHESLLDDPANPVNPFSTSAWMLHFIDQIAAEDWTIVVPEANRRGNVLMLLWCLTDSPSKCSALSNYYASLFSPILGTGPNREEAIEEIAAQLSDMRPRASTVNLAPLDAESADTAQLTSALSAGGWYVRRYACFGNWYLPCVGLSFESYMDTRDSQLRNTLKRKSKKLLASGKVEVVTDVSGVEAAMDAYDAVYGESWKKPEPYPRFVRGWARVCAERGWLRLGIVTVNEVPIAVQFWIIYKSRAYIFKLAYDEDQAKWSAGTVLTAHMIRHALDVDRVVEIDYLTGDDDYKKFWMTHRRERVGLMACNLRSFRGLAAAMVEFGGQSRARIRNQVSSASGRLFPAR